MSALAEPRTGLRDVEPYVSPQRDVAARLNTNECPHPLPEGFFEELAEAVRDLPLHRYPDANMTRLRAELAAASRHAAEGIWAANGSNEILTQLLQAYGGPARTAVTFEPTYLFARGVWAGSSPGPLHGELRPRSRRPARGTPVADLPLYAE
jgi:histidinol-phosphate aminotransferase